MKKSALLVLLLAAAVSCGRRGSGTPAPPAPRSFPMVEVPSMYSEPAERMEYAAGHFWNAFLDTASIHPSDSSLINGVKAGTVESMMANFIALTQPLPLEKGRAAVRSFALRLESFGKKYPEASVWPDMVSMTEKYLFDPNSPLRDEDLYGPFARMLAESSLTPDGRRTGYRWIAEKCNLNSRGTRAADFSFTDLRGRRRTLYGIPAERLLLIFGNPDCKGCREILGQIAADAHLSQLVASGKLKIVDVYIDEDVAAWKAGSDRYPTEWINGYDHTHSIRGDVVYNVRALPSLYLLDRDKTVLLKDAPADRILAALSAF